MLVGAVFGVMINQLLPSVATIGIIITINACKLPAILQRFSKEYTKETE